MSRAFLGLGSNMGDKAEHLRAAVRLLEAEPAVRVFIRSSFYASAPVGYLEQDDFVNAVVGIETQLSPDALLVLCQKIEYALNRVRTIHWGPRTIDLDILLYDALTLNLPDLILPHQRMHERAFVLVPLAEIAPYAELKGQTVKAWLKTLEIKEIKVLKNEKW